MQTAAFAVRKVLTVLSSLLLFQFVMVFQSCEKTVYSSATRDAELKKGKPKSYYWSATAANTYTNVLFISDNTYGATLQASYRG